MREIERGVEPSPVGISPRERDAIAHLVAQRNSLVTRLETGSRQIEQMRAAGEDVAQWERFWVRLLSEYERVCDKLREHEERAELRQVG